jgi:putative Holliday junction resolvase
MGRILAIDFGLKRTGIAVTDPLQIIANAIDTIPTQEIFGFLEKYFEKEKVETIVVGYPLNLDDSPTHATAEVEKFIQRLSKKFPEIKVEKEDERFTSKMAVEAMVAGGMKKKDRRKKENIDKISATIILQSYLEKS